MAQREECECVQPEMSTALQEKQERRHNDAVGTTAAQAIIQIRGGVEKKAAAQGLRQFLLAVKRRYASWRPAWLQRHQGCPEAAANDSTPSPSSPREIRAGSREAAPGGKTCSSNQPTAGQET